MIGMMEAEEATGDRGDMNRVDSAGHARREALRLGVLGALGLGVEWSFGFAGDAGADSLLEARAGDWLTWSPLSPTGASAWASDRRGIGGASAIDSHATGSEVTAALVKFWDASGGIPIWTRILLQKLREGRSDPVRAARALALLHTAIADATIACWKAKFVHRPQGRSQQHGGGRGLSKVPPGLPSYPCEHAAIAAAASTVLADLYPAETAEVRGERMTFHAAAMQAARSRLSAGACFPTDVEAGLAFGEAVGLLAVARGRNDGSAAVWEPSRNSRPLGQQYWTPTAPDFIFPPWQPLAGNWTPWLLDSGDQLRAASPVSLKGTFPDPAFLDEIAELKRTVDGLSEAQRAQLGVWADAAGGTAPAHWIDLAAECIFNREWSTPRVARAMALVSVGLADTAIACWDSKYAYWTPRPITMIRTLQGQSFHDPNFLPPVVTPPSPSYPSEQAALAACAAAIMESLMPGCLMKGGGDTALSPSQAAAQAATAQLHAGTQYRSDVEQGQICGRKVAEAVLRRAERDGAS